MKTKRLDDIYPPEFITELAISNLRASFFIASIKMDVYKKLEGKKLSLKQFHEVLNIPSTSARALAQNLSNMGLINYIDGKIINSSIAKKYLINDEITKKLIFWLSDYAPKPYELISSLKNPPRQPWYMFKNHQNNIVMDLFNKKNFIDSSFYTDPHDLRIKWGNELADKYDFSKHRCLLDLGGACGGWTIGILGQYPKLKAVIFERPEIATDIEKILKKHINIAHRIKIIKGDFFVDKIPETCDVVLLANVLHDWSQDDCQIILENIISSVKQNTAFLINEFYFNNNWKNSNYGALQSMLVLGPDNKSGWQPSYSEMKQLLKKVGLRKIEQRKNLLIAYK